jgi:hypothetical protein
VDVEVEERQPEEPGTDATVDHEVAVRGGHGRPPGPPAPDHDDFCRRVVTPELAAESSARAPVATPTLVAVRRDGSARPALVAVRRDGSTRPALSMIRALLDLRRNNICLSLIRSSSPG